MEILIAEDSPPVVERLMVILRELPELHIAGHAHDVTTAIRRFRDLSPDAVILDLHLADGSGIEVLEEIKRLKPTTIVIVLTNYPTPQYRQKCHTAGAEFFLDKSIEFDKVSHIFRELVQKAPKPAEVVVRKSTSLITGRE
jgi:DNA-binding NarL/FixJ family response regulator